MASVSSAGATLTSMTSLTRPVATACGRASEERSRRRPSGALICVRASPPIAADVIRCRHPSGRGGGSGRNMKNLLVGAVAAGALLGTGAIAGASIPGSNGDITACVSRGGAVRIIDAAVTACKTEPSSQAEQTLTWPSAQPDVPTISFVRGTGSPALEITTPGGLAEFRSDHP
jgi:hypothetical protein